MVTKGLEMADQLWGNLKDQKIPLSVLAAILYVLYLGYGWADRSFIPLSMAAEYASVTEMKKLQASVDKNGQVISTHIEDYTIGDAIRVMEAIESEMRNLQALESVGGKTPEIALMLESLGDRLEHAQAYCDCLMANSPNCKHLKNGR